MKKIICIVIVVFLSFATVLATKTIECEIRDNTCNSAETDIIYLNNNFQDNNGNVLSSNTAINNSGSYSKVLCCKPITGSFDLTIINSTNQCNNGDELMYYTNDMNARVRFNSSFELTDENKVLEPFDLNDYKYKSCISKPDEFSLFEIITSDKDYSYLGYTCLYRVSDIENGLISECSAEYGTQAQQYNYTVWARLWEDVSSLKCNTDCTSKLDNRVYSSCANQIEACKNVPESCNGALLNSWVPLEGTNNEILCSPPWDTKRSKSFTDEKIEVTSSSEKCKNIITKTYPVLYENQKVNMNIHICKGN